MASPLPGIPEPTTGLPPGVAVGPLGPRFLAYLVDAVVPGVLGALLGLIVPGLTGGTRTLTGVVLVALLLGWLVLLWRMIAVRAASPGMRLMGLQVVGFYDGRPLGWGRTLLRGLILGLLSLTGIGLIVMVVLLVLHPRRQGWHDLASRGVVIRQRALAPRPQSELSVGAAGPPVQLEPIPNGGYLSESYETSGPPAPSPDDTSPASPYSRPPGVPARPGDWIAELDDGREVPLERLVLFGRNPQPQPGEEDAHLVKLADETRTVSKSHLGIGLDAAGLFVVDRGSTNGSTVTDPTGASVRIQAGEVVYVETGSIVSIGDHWLRVHRIPPEAEAAYESETDVQG